MALLTGELSRIGWLLSASFLLSDQETVTWLSVSIALTMCLIQPGVGPGRRSPVWREDDVGTGLGAFKIVPSA